MGDERILIWGAGAIGGTVGAYLRRAGLDVAFVDVVSEHVDAIIGPGLHVSGPLDNFRVQAPAFLPGALNAAHHGVWGRILLCVRPQQTEAAALALRPHLEADGVVISLQNGLNACKVAALVGPGRTLAACIDLVADRIGPGEVRYAHAGSLALGEPDARMTPRLAAMCEVLRRVVPTCAVPDIAARLWGRLGHDALLFAQALGARGTADGLARPELFAAWRALGSEVVQVALAEGVSPRGFGGFDPAAFRPGADAAAARASLGAMLARSRAGPETQGAAWRDIAVRGRPTEVAAQLGPVIALAGRHAIAVPALRRLVGLVREVECRRRPQSDALLLELLP